eukprot:768169-Hanusia_phi.AAC.3
MIGIVVLMRYSHPGPALREGRGLSFNGSLPCLGSSRCCRSSISLSPVLARAMMQILSRPSGRQMGPDRMIWLVGGSQRRLDSFTGTGHVGMYCWFEMQLPSSALSFCSPTLLLQCITQPRKTREAHSDNERRTRITKHSDNESKSSQNDSDCITQPNESKTQNKKQIAKANPPQNKAKGKQRQLTLLR